MDDSRGNLKNSDRYSTALLLTLVGGYMAGFTINTCSNVIANGQTGNLARLAISLVIGNFEVSLHYLIPAILFFIGITAVCQIRNRWKDEWNYSFLHWRQPLLAIEMIILVIVGFIPLSSNEILVISLVSLSASLQYGSFRYFHGKQYSNTFCTGNFRSAVINLNNYWLNSDHKSLKTSLRYFGINGTYMIGAVSSLLCSKVIGSKSIWFCCVVLAAVFISVHPKKEATFAQ